MKILYSQLKMHLAKQLSPLYLISTDEILLAEEAATLIRKVAFEKGFTENICTTFETVADWEAILYSDTHTLSLFSTKKIVEFNFQLTKFNSAHGKILEEYALKPLDSVLLIVRTPKLDAKIEKSVWYKTLEKHAVIIPIKPIPLEQLPAWIIERAKTLELQLTQDAAYALSYRMEGNLLGLAQEIEKLSLLESKKTIDLKTIENMVTDNAQYDIFDLVGACTRNDKKRAIQILQNLANNTEPTLVLWALTRELRMLADIFQQTKEGRSLSTLFEKHRIFGKHEASVKSFIQRRSLKDCLDALLQAARVDRVIKGVETGDPWMALEQLSLNIIKM
jgi:DNA polymerase III subunit delta